MATSGITIATAKGSAMSLAGTRPKWSSWTVRHMCDPIDGSNFESGGKDEGDIGFDWLEWEAEGLWDLGAHPNVAGFYPNAALANLLLYVNLALNIKYAMVLARCLSGGPVAQVRAGVLYRASGRSQGTFTVPPA